LRLNYEAKPIAFLMQQAGGTALAGDENILDIVPSELHQRVSVNMGNTNIVERYKEIS
jgi:fructose-1,6-bisphosphatase